MINFEELENQVKEVLEYSQNLKGLNVKQLLSDWYNAKYKYIKALNDNLIYEYPEKVTFELSESAKARRIEEFADMISYTYDNGLLGSFIYDMKNCFFSNATDRDYYVYDSNKGKETLIQKGTKIVKAFKYFESDEKLLFDLQNKASAIIQENKVTGTLCFSVHPLDFLSSSENIHNWRSCHALDGEYRAGNLSYMTDSSTCIIYLKSDKDAILPNFPSTIPWNSKKWRVLLFFSNDASMLFLGRQYPFASDSAPDFITQYLLIDSGLFKPNTKWTPWTDETVDSVTVNKIDFTLRDSYIPVGGVLKRKKELIKDGEYALNFNDLLRSTCYEPIYCYTQQPHERTFDLMIYEFDMCGQYGNKNTVFEIGGKVSCCKCGKDYVKNSETVLCNDCEEKYGNLNNDDFGYCNVCGRHFMLDEATWINDEPVCPSCADSEVVTCGRCGSLVWKDQVHYNREIDDYICDWCEKNLHRYNEGEY